MTLLSIAAVMRTLEIVRLNLGGSADWFLLLSSSKPLRSTFCRCFVVRLQCCEFLPATHHNCQKIGCDWQRGWAARVWLTDSCATVVLASRMGDGEANSSELIGRCRYLHLRTCWDWGFHLWALKSLWTLVTFDLYQSQRVYDSNWGLGTKRKMPSVWL